MTKIIPLRHSDIEKVRKMIEYVSPETSPDRLDEGSFIHFPFNALHGILPVNLKFLQECYVLMEGNELLGLISLSPDGNQKTRWKINRLILNPNAYDAGKQLIDYVVNKYGGAGVEIFVTTIHENYTEAISLFKNACFFRSWSNIHIWEYENMKNIGISEPQIPLRKLAVSDAKKLYELDSEAIHPQFRTAFIKTEKDFKFGLKNKLTNRLKGRKCERFVLENPQINSIEAFLSIMTEDKVNFWIDITLSLAYQEYYNDILSFALNRIYSINKNGKIFVGVRGFHQTGKKMADILAMHNFRQTGSFEVLVKDYWRPAEHAVEKKVPIMIFPDMTSPACNITRVIKEI